MYNNQGVIGGCQWLLVAEGGMHPISSQMRAMVEVYFRHLDQKQAV
jgi:hypothetical protein